LNQQKFLHRNKRNNRNTHHTMAPIVAMVAIERRLRLRLRLKKYILEFIIKENNLLITEKII